jgi:hypothetical protein
MGNEISALQLVIGFAILAALVVCIKMLCFPHKYKAEPMSFDLRALKKPEYKRASEVPAPAPAKPAIRKCKVHPPKRGR